MKAIFTVIALCALISTGALSSPAAADDRRRGSGHSALDSKGHLGLGILAGERHRDGFRQRHDRRHHKLRRHHRDKRQHVHRHHGHQRHAQRRHGHQHHGQRHHGQQRGWHRGHRHGHFGHGLAGRCHPVQRLHFGHHGQRLLIGAVLCPSPYGGSYIVDGSHHVIRRF